MLKSMPYYHEGCCHLLEQRALIDHDQIETINKFSFYSTFNIYVLFRKEMEHRISIQSSDRNISMLASATNYNKANTQ